MAGKALSGSAAAGIALPRPPTERVRARPDRSPSNLRMNTMLLLSLLLMADLDPLADGHAMPAVRPHRTARRALSPTKRLGLANAFSVDAPTHLLGVVATAGDVAGAWFRHGVRTSLMVLPTDDDRWFWGGAAEDRIDAADPDAWDSSLTGDVGPLEDWTSAIYGEPAEALALDWGTAAIGPGVLWPDGRVPPRRSGMPRGGGNGQRSAASGAASPLLLVPPTEDVAAGAPPVPNVPAGSNGGDGPNGPPSTGTGNEPTPPLQPPVGPPVLPPVPPAAPDNSAPDQPAPPTPDPGPGTITITAPGSPLPFPEDPFTDPGDPDLPDVPVPETGGADPVPEPATLLLWSALLLAVWLMRRRSADPTTTAAVRPR